MKKGLISSIFVLAASLTSLNSQAACNLSSVHVDRLDVDDSGTTIYLKAWGATVSYTMYTTSSALVTTALGAYENGTMLDVQGNAATCPAEGYIGQGVYLRLEG